MPALNSSTVQLANLDLVADAPHSFLGEILICGVRHYVQVIEVCGADTKESMVAVNEELQDRIDAVADFDAGGDEPGYETVQFNGRPHFVLIYPYQR